VNENGRSIIVDAGFWAQLNDGGLTEDQVSTIISAIAQVDEIPFEEAREMVVLAWEKEAKRHETGEMVWARLVRLALRATP